MRALGPLAALLLGGCGASEALILSAGDKPQRLEPGAASAGTLDLEKSKSIDLVVDVPADAVALRVELTCRDAELDLTLKKGEAVEDPADADAKAKTDGGRAYVRIDRFADPVVERGRWHVGVSWPDSELPRSGETRVTLVHYSLTARIYHAASDQTLEIGKRTGVEIAAHGSGQRTLRVDVPAGTAALRLDVADTDSDVDLYAHAGAPFTRFDESVQFAQHLYGRETLVIKPTSGATITPGPWFVDVVDLSDEDRPVHADLLATLGREPPAELLALPVLALQVPSGDPAISRALAAVVELATSDATGSGTLVASDGWILTNAHVVETLGGGPVQEVVVAISLDAARPAVELFRAHVERYDEERDLALLHVVSGFYGQPIPTGYRFPTVDLGASAGLAIGSPLWIVGYPATGGEGSRVTISATRGVLSGFDRAPFGRLLKTDAEVTSGNSGGAALDAAGRLVGVPSATVENGSGQIGYVHPIEALPQEWRALFATPTAPR